MKEYKFKFISPEGKEMFKTFRAKSEEEAYKMADTVLRQYRYREWDWELLPPLREINY